MKWEMSEAKSCDNLRPTNSKGVSLHPQLRDYFWNNNNVEDNHNAWDWPEAQEFSSVQASRAVTLSPTSSEGRLSASPGISRHK